MISIYFQPSFEIFDEWRTDVCFAILVYVRALDCAERNSNGSSQTRGCWLGCSLTVRPATNGYLVATLMKLKAMRKGTGYPISLYRPLRVSVVFNRHSPTQAIALQTNLCFYLLIKFYSKAHLTVQGTNHERT